MSEEAGVWEKHKEFGFGPVDFKGLEGSSGIGRTACVSASTVCQHVVLGTSKAT